MNVIHIGPVEYNIYYNEPCTHILLIFFCARLLKIGGHDVMIIKPLNPLKCCMQDNRNFGKEGLMRQCACNVDDRFYSKQEVFYT